MGWPTKSILFFYTFNRYQKMNRCIGPSQALRRVLCHCATHLLAEARRFYEPIVLMKRPISVDQWDVFPSGKINQISTAWRYNLQNAG